MESFIISSYLQRLLQKLDTLNDVVHEINGRVYKISGATIAALLGQTSSSNISSGICSLFISAPANLIANAIFELPAIAVFELNSPFLPMAAKGTG